MIKVEGLVLSNIGDRGTYEGVITNRLNKSGMYNYSTTKSCLQIIISYDIPCSHLLDDMRWEKMRPMLSVLAHYCLTRFSHG